MPGWDFLLRFVEKDPEIFSMFKNMYPRIIPHRDVAQFTKIMLEKYGAEGQNAFLFSSSKAAEGCKAYGISSLRENALKEDEISVRVFDVHTRIYAVFFPAQKFPEVFGYYSNAGFAISSRLGEDCLKHIDSLREVTDNSPPPHIVPSPAHAVLKKRIAGLLERAPAGPPRTKKVSPDDVYFFPTGMAAIYSVHQMLQARYKAASVLFGFAFHSTIHVFEDWDSTGFKFLGLGTAEDIETLEQYIEAESKEGRKVHAVYLEFPSNPLIVTPDLVRLRKLADRYHFALVVDDTIGSFCNVDVLEAADIIVTSLTKSFSGYSDLMCGGVVLNPSSSLYAELKDEFSKSIYTNDFYDADAEALEINSRDYLERSTVLNNNAQKLTEYLQNLTLDPTSSVAKVWYPTVLPSLINYEAFMRTKTEDFTPGYGCLFSVEFINIEATKAFYENVQFHIGPHLGAHLTLVMPYTKGLYGKQLEWAEQYHLKETQMRVSVGLEDTETLIQVFKNALEVADKAIAKEPGKEPAV
ncbi:pyridoxal phosphate-dependent transferase [Bisporella sp. PMI_857]|nr:pyridoxal phosphate-dependent transferase [Bisporella sp. PMI_857]